ncbi:hypothetical protein [Saprospira grandis]|uniref:hypothetical protein n=1 Tax=Saprospira grandis TaxID=1008 RepID=UPI0022DE39B6|nr:hypothetical protein [Saprospira grandis]WBM74141.1 hypothetical protein OP864_14225 [Saprospira grandis]
MKFIGIIIIMCISFFEIKAQEPIVEYIRVKNFVRYFYIGTQQIKAEGKINTTLQKVGKWKYFYKNGDLRGVSLFDKDGNKKGVWVYYKLNGDVEKKIKIRKGGGIVIEDSNKRKISLEEVEEPILFKWMDVHSY